MTATSAASAWAVGASSSGILILHWNGRSWRRFPAPNPRNGAIYAVRRSDYADVDPRFGHDLALPYLMVQRGRRAVYEPAAVAYEKPTPSMPSCPRVASRAAAATVAQSRSAGTSAASGVG